MTCTDDRNRKIACAVVIPALDPPPGLATLVGELLRKGIPRVIVVNDGSDSSCDAIFRDIGRTERCTLLTHDRTLGKGRALKTAFGYFLRYCSSLDGVVTADSDGQHALDDIVALCRRVSGGDRALVLGVRSFQQRNVPKRNHLGNALALTLFRLLYGSRLADTQTGLRGIPTGEIPWMVEVPGDRYEYEMNMLINATRRGIPISSVPIRTLYPDGGARSHYAVLRDTARIFAALVSGLCSSRPSGRRRIHRSPARTRRA